MSKPFHEPPIQSRHLGYGLALPWVSAAITRFHRIEGVDGLEHVPEPGTPMIVVANHQNGLMDPLVLCSLLSRHQIHWLTRSDIFYQRVVRFFLFSFNMLPIFRRRDRLADIGERNQRIFEICVERLNLGAVVGLYPEGNHNGERSLRPLKRGVIDMLNLAQTTHAHLKEDLVLLPVGIDYEDYGSLRRRLRYRIGAPLNWASWIDPETGAIPANQASRAIAGALDALMINVQPAKHYGDLNPYVQALRSTEQGAETWQSTRDRIASLESLSEPQLEAVAAAWASAQSVGVGSDVRPEDLGTRPEETRKGTAWVWALAPFILVPNALNALLSVVLQAQARKRVKDICFVSTFKSAAGMVLYPVVWALVAAVWAVAAPPAELGGGWTFAFVVAGQTVASRLGVWWYGHALDERGRRRAKRFWADEKRAAAWTAYVNTIETSKQ